MTSLFSCGIGALLRTLGSQTCGNRALRCNNRVISNPFYATIRWFTNSADSSNRPKRPLTAYIRYVQEQQPLCKKQNPGLQITELTKHIAVSWKQLSETQKQVYVEAAIIDLQVYKKEVSEYKAQLSGAQLHEMKEARRQRRLKRKKTRQKRALTVLGKPKRPRSPFNIFMTEHFEEASGDFATTKLKTLGDDWQKRSEAQKQPYIQLSQDDQIRYENEMKSWEEHMVEIGRQDVIRYKSRNKLKIALAGKKTKRRSTDTEKTGTSKSTSKNTSSSPTAGKHERKHTTEE